MAQSIPIERRREVFAALVVAQDAGLDVAASRKKIAADYGHTTKTIEKIEKEGLEAQWPPFDV